MNPNGSLKRGIGGIKDMKGRSVAVQYEVRLQEILAAAGAVEHSKKPDARRLSCHMALLRELLSSSAFGPMQVLMQTMTEELEKCLYTDELASSSLPSSFRGNNPASSLEKVPFFAELSEVKAKLEKTTSESQTNKEMAETSEKKAKDALRKLHGEGPDAAKATASINLLEYELDKAKSETERVKGELSKAQAQREHDMMALETEVRRWKRASDNAQDQLQVLKQQVQDQESVRRAFAQLHGSGGQQQRDSAQEEASKLEQQLLVLQNARIDEYEAALDTTCNAAQAAQLRSNFVEELGQIQQELELLREHMATQRVKAAGTPTGMGLGGAESSEGGFSLPRGGQRQLEVSSDGMNFTALDQFPGAGQVAMLPPGCTHLRWLPVRAPVEETGKSASGLDVPVPLRPDEASLLRQQGRAEGGVMEAGQQLVGPLWDGFRKACGGHTAATAPMLARQMQLRPLIRTLEELLNAKWQVEQRARTPAGGTKKGTPGSEPVASAEDAELEDPRAKMTLHQFFYEHLKEKYVLPPTVLLVAHGILSAIERCRSSHAVVMLVSRVLSCELDEATWRYTMHWRRLLASGLPLSSTRDFGVLVNVLYPAVREEELSDLCMSFATHSSEPPSPSTALEFLTGRLLAKQEPRLRKWLKILKWKDTHHRNSFRRQEFLEIGAKLFQLIKGEDVAREYDGVSSRYGGERVPIDALAYVACCLDAMSITFKPEEDGPVQTGSIFTLRIQSFETQ
ncbi:hypothetical protein CYMTET_7620 [Cymbomonas tetramitiformis]|uniref:Uncharacterized protein n=1 Tax=Cymbomonas tetramitiformis TaxID=36881 RepID=A0AAE0GV37_9CHLO|nr:hypothetical protein CYMTET_7620 [Cymbomonas tetramitiformis]